MSVDLPWAGDLVSLADRLPEAEAGLPMSVELPLVVDVTALSDSLPA